MLIIDLRNKRILSKYSYSVVGNKDSDVILFYSHFVQYANHNVYLKVLNDYYADKIDIPAENVRVEDGVLVVEWTMNEASCYGDKLMLQLQFEKDDEIAQSSIAIVTLANTLNVSETIEQQYPRVLEHLQEEIDALGDIDALVEVSYENGIFTFTSKDGNETEVDLTEDFALSNKTPKIYTVSDYTAIPTDVFNALKNGDIVMANGYVFSVIERTEHSVETRCMFYDGLTECQTVKECRYYDGQFEGETDYPFGDVKSVNYAYPDEYGNVNLNIEPKYDGDLTFHSIMFVSKRSDFRKFYPPFLTDKLKVSQSHYDENSFLEHLCIEFKSNPIPYKVFEAINDNRLVIRFDYPVGIRNNDGGAGKRSFCFFKRDYKNNYHEGLIYRVKTSDIKTSGFGEKYLNIVIPLHDFVSQITIPRNRIQNDFEPMPKSSHILTALREEIEDGSPLKDYNRPAWCKLGKNPVSNKTKTFGTNLSYPSNGYYLYNSETRNNPMGFIGFHGMSKTLLSRYYQEVCYKWELGRDLETSYVEFNRLPLRLKDYHNYGDEGGSFAHYEQGWVYFNQNRRRFELPSFELVGKLKRKNKFVVKPRFAILAEADIEDLPSGSSPIWLKAYPQSQQQIQIFIPSVNMLEDDLIEKNYDAFFVNAQVSITKL